MTRPQINAQRGDTIRSPYEDDVTVTLLANTPVGIAFQHPSKGHCSLRYDSMTDDEYRRISLNLQ